MSRYLQTLKRLQQQRVPESLEDWPPSVSDTQPEGSLSEPASAERASLFPELHLGHREAAWAGLLDVLRAQSPTGSKPVVVLAAVSHLESVEPIVSGLAGQARKRGVNLGIVDLELVRGTRLLRERAHVVQSQSDPAGSQEPESTIADSASDLDLSSVADPQQLRSWFDEVRATTDLVIVKAPSILRSADTLLVSRACDGLVVVVEELLTERTSLQAAVDRAKMVGCPLLGIVVSGHRRWLPKWLVRLLDGTGSK